MKVETGLGLEFGCDGTQCVWARGDGLTWLLGQGGSVVDAKEDARATLQSFITRARMLGGGAALDAAVDLLAQVQ